jgi:hypothetical protein
MLASIARRAVVVGAVVFGATSLSFGQPLHAVIDEHLSTVDGQQAQLCSDAEYLRRASLDLTGMPPTADEARAFLTDTAPDKRERLVDRLLASPHYARHLATTLDVMLMERRPHTHVSADEWQAWLLKSVQENKPWNALVKELLLADGDDPAQRAAARFTLDRACDPHAVTRDVGRIFFGRDLQCAQCHDHPLVEDYLQSDYHGLLAFVAADYTLVRKEGDQEKTVRGEKAGSDAQFESVFVGTARRTKPRMPGEVAIEEPFFLPGEEYEAPPADNVKAVPKFSRREKLAELATDGSNEAFNRTIANRLWAHMFGRGLVHPPDFDHSGNPPQYPALLKILAERLVSMGFDIRSYLREIALSQAYQRAIDVPADLLQLVDAAANKVEQLEADRTRLEQIAESSAAAYEAALEAWHQAEATLVPMAGELDTARTTYAEAKKKLDDATLAKNDAASRHAAKQQVVTPVAQAAEATKNAVGALPDDQELAAAAEKFVARAEQLKAELAALGKEVEEKQTALEPLTPAVDAAKTKVTASLSHLEPLDDTWMQAEQAMLAARTQAASDAEALAALEEELRTARGVAQLPATQQVIAEVQAQIAEAESALAAAGQESTKDGSTVLEKQSAVEQSTTALSAAEQVLADARAQHTPRTEFAGAVAAAFTSARAALEKLPADAELTEISARLEARAAAAATATTASQQGVDTALAAHQSATQALAQAQSALSSAQEEQSRQLAAVRGAEQALAEKRAQLTTARAEYDDAVSKLTQRWTHNLTVAVLKPLTPEQLCWSVLRVTGVYDRTWQAQAAELDKASPLSEAEQNDPAAKAARHVTLEQKTFDALKGTVGTYVQLFGAAAGQPQNDFFSTPDQALFAANGGAVNSWVAPATDNVTERIVKLEDPRAAAEELYLSVLTRLPTSDESAEVAAYLQERAADKAQAAQELVWGLVNSVEFRFNH